MIDYLNHIFKQHCFKKRWRKRNSHNFTSAVSLFDPDKVTVGNYSYGPLNIQSWGTPGEKLEIGHFVSIAAGVQIVLGGNHRIDTFSTYPFRVQCFGKAREATTKGSIVIQDDVWIGTNAIIMSGVTIGKGAVIAGGSVVVKSVPPYAIAAGNPARVVKYRFSQGMIDKLMAINYSQLTCKQLEALKRQLYLHLTDSVLDEIQGVLEAKGLGENNESS